MTEYITKDSGERQEFDSGMKRDTESGKPRFDLMVPDGVPYDQQLLTRFAMLLSRGAEKYDERNWEKGDSMVEINRARSSAFRHFMQWFCGERDEDHPAAVIFNLMVVETIERKMRADTPVEEKVAPSDQEQLLAYSEWLDGEGLIVDDWGVDDKGTHEELAQKFLGDMFTGQVHPEPRTECARLSAQQAIHDHTPVEDLRM